VSDLLQALLLVAAGGGIGLVSSYFQYRWTSKAGDVASDRAALQRNLETARTARRDFRRKRITPVLEYISKLQAFDSQSKVENVLKKVDESYQSNREATAKQLGGSVETLDSVYQQLRQDWLGAAERTEQYFQVFRAIFPALQTAPTDEIRDAIGISFGQVNSGQPPANLQGLLDLVDDYVVDV